jgi:hypothetical protein
MGLVYDIILGRLRKRDETTTIGGGAVTYDNSTSGLTSTTVQGAIDELDNALDALDQVFILQGTWDASTGVFPGGGTAQAGYVWIVSDTGTVDGVEFTANQDHIVALVDNASTTVYDPNWYKSDGSVSPTEEWEVAFVEVEEVLQSFNKGYVLNNIDVTNVATIAYDKNETGIYTALTITAGSVTIGLPTVADGDTLTWQITYDSGKDKASIIVKGTKV